MWIIMAVLSAFFAGITAILAKIGMKNLDSDIATALRSIIILIFSWGIVYFTGIIYEIKYIDIYALVFLIFSGIATGLSWLCYFKALSLGDVNKIVAIDKSSIVLTVLLAIILFDESNFLEIKILGSAAILIGLLLMIERKDAKLGINKNNGIIYAILSAVFAAMTAILGKYGINNIESNLGTAIRVGVILCLSWLIVIFRGKFSMIKAIKEKEMVFIFLSAITTGLSWLCYYYALQNGIVSVVAVIDKLSILVSVLFSWIIFKEYLTRKSCIGLVLIFIGTLSMVIWH